MSSNTSLIFSDYGFDPQIDYFQVLEEARKHTKETSSPDSIHQFKLQKPISKDDLRRTALHKKNKKKHLWFWRNPLLFFSWRKWGRRDVARDNEFDDRDDVHVARARNFRAGSMSGPVYVTESLSGLSTSYRAIRPPPSLTTVTPVVPYLSLRELSMERQQRISATSMSGLMKKYEHRDGRKYVLCELF